MSDNPTGTELALPDSNLGKKLWIAIETAQREADFAREMLTEADNPEEASRSMTILNTRLNELAQIGQVAAEALAAVADVAKTLKTQRDEAIQECDDMQENMEELACEIADENVNEWLTWNLGDVVDEEIADREQERTNEEKMAVEGLEGLGLTNEAQALQQALETARQAKAEADGMVEKAQEYLDKNDPDRAAYLMAEHEDEEDWGLDDEDEEDFSED
jgi:hypothetical protein